MNIESIKNRLFAALNNRQDILFAYLHGSLLNSDDPNDIDIAVYLNPDIYNEFSKKEELVMGFSIPLEIELENILSMKVDIQLLNDAPLRFRYNVISNGDIILNKNDNARCDFESLSRVEYFEIRPKREEYLREALS